jgi:hypothetical protein
MRLGIAMRALGMRPRLTLGTRPGALLIALGFRRMVGEEIVDPTQPGAQALA